MGGEREEDRAGELNRDLAAERGLASGMAVGRSRIEMTGAVPGAGSLPPPG